MLSNTFEASIRLIIYPFPVTYQYGRNKFLIVNILEFLDQSFVQIEYLMFQEWFRSTIITEFSYLRYVFWFSLYMYIEYWPH